MHRLQELVRLHRSGCKRSRVARTLGMGRSQEVKYRQALEQAGLLEGDPGSLPELDVLKDAVERYVPPKKPPQQVSSVQSWAEPIRRLFKKGAEPRPIYDWLRQNVAGFTGSYSAVKRFCQQLRKREGPRATDVPIPVDTPAGEVAQVDFGFAGYVVDPNTGKSRRAWIFVLVLGHSRHMFAELVYDQRQETWVTLHQKAFAALGGVPRTLVPDNLKNAVVQRAFGIDGETALNRTYRELARYYGFKVDPTPPRDPDKKGKVERAVKYVKSNFCRTHLPAPMPDARLALANWTRDVAGMRVHGTTRRKPFEVFEAQERATLLALPTTLYEPVIWKKAKVHSDIHVSFGERLYSVPWTLIGKRVWIRATPTTIVIFHDDRRVATHSRGGEGTRITVDAHLPEHRSDYRYRTRGYWTNRAAAIGEAARAYVTAVFDSDEVLSKLRVVQGIVKHLEQFPVERACAACLRALHFGCYSYQGLKNILGRGLDLEPFEQEQSREWQTSLPSPTFARKPTYFLNSVGGD